MYVIKNVSANRLIVCTLGDNSTLRLFPGKEVTLSEGQCTNYLKTLSADTKLLTMKKVADKPPIRKKSSTEKVVEDKEKKED